MKNHLITIHATATLWVTIKSVATNCSDTNLHDTHVMPTLKLHFSGTKITKSRKSHNFQEHVSKYAPAFYEWLQDFMWNLQGSPTLCTSLTDSTQLKVLFASPIISQQYCKFQSSCKCQLSHLQWQKDTFHGILSWTLAPWSFSSIQLAVSRMQSSLLGNFKEISSTLCL